MSKAILCDKCGFWCDLASAKNIRYNLCCDSCYDTLGKEGATTCPRCEGDGYDRYNGLVDPMVPCPECGGHGV